MRSFFYSAAMALGVITILSIFGVIGVGWIGTAFFGFGGTLAFALGNCVWGKDANAHEEMPDFDHTTPERERVDRMRQVLSDVLGLHHGGLFTARTSPVAESTSEQTSPVANTRGRSDSDGELVEVRELEVMIEKFEIMESDATAVQL